MFNKILNLPHSEKFGPQKRNLGMALSSSIIFVLDYQKKHAQGLLMDKGSFKKKKNQPDYPSLDLTAFKFNGP